MSNNERFRKRAKTVKFVWGIAFSIFAIATIVLVCLAIFDKEAVYSEYYNKYSYYTKYQYATTACVLGSIALSFFFFWLFSLIGVKFHTYSYNGYEISLYLGWGCAYLLIDDTIVDKHTGSYYGARPLEYYLEEEKVNLKVGASTLNNYTLKVGSKILH